MEQTAENYLDLEEQTATLKERLVASFNRQHEEGQSIQQAEASLAEVKEQLTSGEAERQKLLSHVRMFERENMALKQEIQEATRETVIASRKNQIRLTEMEKIIGHEKARSQKKELVINELKQEIALYN